MFLPSEIYGYLNMKMRKERHALSMTLPASSAITSLEVLSWVWSTAAPPAADEDLVVWWRTAKPAMAKVIRKGFSSMVLLPADGLDVVEALKRVHLQQEQTGWKSTSAIEPIRSHCVDLGRHVRVAFSYPRVGCCLVLTKTLYSACPACKTPYFSIYQDTSFVFSRKKL